MSKYLTSVIVTTRFEGFHRWEEAPNEHLYLSNPHRHMFHVDMHVEVGHNERQIEIIELKRQLDEYLLRFAGRKNCFLHSCETLATMIADKFNAKMVKVMEDGENGAVVLRQCELSEVGYEALYDKMTEIANKRMKAQIEKDREEVQKHIKETFDSFFGFRKKGEGKSSLYDTKKVKGEAGEMEFKKEGKTPLPSMQKRTKCFVGVECEGPPTMRGKKTLFVPGSVTAGQFVHAYKNAGPVEKVYYGAGNDRVFDKNILELIRTLFHDSQITVEVERVTSEVNEYWMNTAITVVSCDPSDIERADYVKFIQPIGTGPGAVCWTSEKESHLTPLDHPAYSEDKYIEDIVLDTQKI